MAKCRAPRKGMKRPPRRPQAADRDGELDELASVLAEYSLDNNAGGWFRPTWRDGWNAIELALAAAKAKRIADHEVKSGTELSTIVWLTDVCERRVGSSEIYWMIQDTSLGTNDTQIGVLLRAALRCLQILIAKSDGGGEVYNAILVRPFAAMFPEEVYDLVLEYRCRDSIGVSAQLAGDLNDRQRRAFAIAWKRGLYLAAYSLPPAVKDTGKLTIVKKGSK